MKIRALLIFCFLFSPFVHAVGPIVAPVQNVVPERIQAGNQYYDMSVSGLASYMEELRASDAKSYTALKGELEELESRRARATWIPLAVGVGGAVFTVIGAINDPTNYAALGIGLGLATTAALLPYLLSNSRSDFMSFVNKHNRLRPKNPMQIQVGFAPLPTGVTGALALKF